MSMCLKQTQQTVILPLEGLYITRQGLRTRSNYKSLIKLQVWNTYFFTSVRYLLLFMPAWDEPYRLKINRFIAM